MAEFSTMISDESEDDKDDTTDQVEGLGIVRSLTLLDQLLKCTALDDDDIAALVDVTKKLENLRLREKK